MIKYVLTAVAVVIAVVQPANASLVLGLTDGSNSVFVIDNAIAGTLSSGGAWTSSVADNTTAAGVVGFNGSLGAWGVNVSTGASKPALGANEIDLNSINISSTGAGTLFLFLVDTDFVDNGYGFRAAVGGTTRGTASFQFGTSSSNSEDTFLFDSLLGPFSPLAFSGENNTANSVAGSGAFSMLILATITHTAAGQVTSFDASFAQIPEPSSLAVWGLVCGIGFVAGRRRS